MQDIVRVGLISSVNRTAGTARVYYPDREATTAELPLFSGWGETAFPEPGDQVVVIHLSNDTSSGIILGCFYDETAAPQADVDYWKQLGKRAYIKEKDGQLVVYAGNLVLEDCNGRITLEEILNLKKRVEELEQRGE